MGLVKFSQTIAPTALSSYPITQGNTLLTVDMTGALAAQSVELPLSNLLPGDVCIIVKTIFGFDLNISSGPIGEGAIVAQILANASGTVLCMWSGSAWVLASDAIFVIPVP